MKLPILLATACLLAATAMAEPETGKPAPAFTGTDSAGKTRSLADYKGKYVVLEWLNHGCPFVKKHYSSGNMQALQKEYGDKGVVWFSVVSSAPGKQGNMTPEETNKKKEEVESAATAIILDEDGTIGKLYGAKTTPEMFVINPEGVLIYAGGIDNVKSVNPDDVKTATNYVRAALDAAMAGKEVGTPTAASYGCSVKY